MQKWEYLTLLMTSEVEPESAAALRRRFPEDKRFAKFTPAALIPQLDEWGEEGWELMSAQPVRTGDNEDIYISASSGMQMLFTHTYLCIFKRPKE